MTNSRHMGDKGSTAVKGGRMKKDSRLMAALGDLDELLAVMAVAGNQVDGVGMIADKISKELSFLMGYLAGYTPKIDLQEAVRLMDQDIAAMEKELGKVEQFLDVQRELNVWFNWARTVSRRAERSVVALSREQDLNPEVLVFLNRLSLYLFWLGRRVR